MLSNIVPGSFQQSNLDIINATFASFCEKYPARPFTPKKQTRLKLPQSRRRRRKALFKILQRLWYRNRARLQTWWQTGWKCPPTPKLNPSQTQSKTPKPLYICFIDVKKAFDSVSHQSLLLACKRMGLPEPLVNYIQSLYSQGTTWLAYNGKLSRPIKCGGGVKQGDPLSCYLFNSVIDWVLLNVDPNIGATNMWTTYYYKHRKDFKLRWKR